MGKTRGILVGLLVVGALRGQESLLKSPKAAPSQDIWEAAHLDNGRAGYFVTSFQEIEEGGKKFVRARQSLNLSIRRAGSVMQLRMQSGTDEDADGKVVGVFTRMEQDGGPLVIEGKVKDRVLHVEVKDRFKREIPWNDKVIGLRAQEQLFEKKKLKGGDKLDYRAYEPSLLTVVTVRAVLHDEEEVDLMDRQKMKLFRAVLTADKIEVPGQAAIQLPPVTVWLDKEGKIRRRQVEIPGLGKILLVRTTREAATAQTSPAALTDILSKNEVPLSRRIARPNDTESVVYRITIDDDHPETALARDERQQVKAVKGKTIELHVKAVRSAPEDGKGEAKKEFLDSCRYIDSDNPRIKELAREAVGTETDPWFMARRIEGWVHRNMTIDASVPMGSAGAIVRDGRTKLRGDCRQYALLTAALCRAAGVPSRTAIGLIYADKRGGQAIFGFHMWAEVFVRGHWLALDATLGEGSVGAAHIKVTDHSWAGVESLTPLLPLQRVLGKMKIDVVQVEH